MSPSRLALLEGTLKACTDDFTERRSTFSELDKKAQDTTTVAGIFLAAAFAFYNQEALQNLLTLGGWFGSLLLAATVVFLLGSVVFCLLAMMVRKVPSPTDSEDVVEMVKDLMELPTEEFTETTAENFLRDQIDLWQSALQGIGAANDSKARSLHWGQLLLVLAIVMAGGFLLLVLKNATLG